jgi:hypothetical protein
MQTPSSPPSSIDERPPSLVNSHTSPVDLSFSPIDREQALRSGSAPEHQQLRWSPQEGALSHLRQHNNSSSSSSRRRCNRNPLRPPVSLIHPTAPITAPSVLAQVPAPTAPREQTKSLKSSSLRSRSSLGPLRKIRIAIQSGNNKLNSSER